MSKLRIITNFALTKMIDGNENILFVAIDNIDDQNVEEQFTYVPNNDGLPEALRFNGPITQRVRHLRNGLERQYNAELMTRETVRIAIPNHGDFIHDGPVLYYNSPQHGIVRIYYYEKWIFHSYV